MKTTSSDAPRQAENRITVALVVGLLCLVLALVSCSSGDTPDDTLGGESEGTAGLASSARALATQVDVATITGKLPGTRRRGVRKEVTDVLDRWWDAAYLQGERPGADLRTAFPGFTIGARTRARADQALTTNRSLRAASITPLMRKARLDILALGGRARSVTARFDVRARVRDASGQRARRLQVRGRVFLTHHRDGWRIFGYDVSRGWLS